MLPGRTVVGTRRSEPGAEAWAAGAPIETIPIHAEIGSTRLARHLRWRIEHQIRRRPLSWRQGRAAHRALRQVIVRHRVEVVLAEYLDAWLPFLHTVQSAGARFVAHAHGLDVSQRLQEPHWPAKYRLLNAASAVVTMSAASRTRLLEIGLHPDRVEVIPYGVDVGPEPEPRQAQTTVKLVAIGRLVPKKAPLVLLAAFDQARQIDPTLQLELDVVGDGPLMDAAAGEVSARRLAGVRLHGSQPHDVVRKLLDEGDVFLQHSVRDPSTGDEEGLPVAILEAMASGLPVVSTRHAGIPEAVAQGATGLLVEPGDARAMAEAIVRLARDIGLRQELGRAGWARAQSRFTWERERTSLLSVMQLRAEEERS